MRANYVQTSLKTAVLVTIVLLLGTSFASGQAQQVNLTAAPTTLTMPDGSMVPMWGYTCTSLAAGVTSNASCAALNTAGNGWAPVIITVPSGQDLQINLTNNLSFPAQDSNGNVTGINNVPTSLVMVGQLGGGLGKTATYIASPNHDNQPTTWPIPNGGAIFTPPSQGPRVQSFSTEVAGTPSTVAQTATQLVWTNPRPGTYLLESGTHPSIQGSMGLYGIVVVTSAPSSSAPGCAYPGAAAGPCTVPYNADIPLLLSEIDPVQNNAVQAAVGMTGFNEAATVGPYAGGAIANINVVNPGSGYTTAPIVNIVGGGGSGATAVATIDTDNTSATYRQVLGVNITNAGTGYTSAPTVTLSGGGGTKATAAAYLTLGANAIAHCSGGALACYPPVVNYTPLYYMINGVSFDKTKGSNSLFTAAPNSGVTGNVLVRIVNAGSRMHVPAIVGSQVGASGASGFALIAEDGNPLPGVPRVQSEVFMAAGKTYDVMINVPAANSTALPIYDRELSLSGNAIDRDAGMLAYISVNGAGLPSAPALAGAIAKDDTYNSVVSGNQLSISDPAKGVIANDFNVYGVKVLTAPQHAAVVGGVVQFGLNSNGTFTYTPDASWSAASPTITDSFVYQANGSGPTATVTLGAAPIELASGIVCTSIPAYNSTVATTLSIKPPGILAFCKDAAGYPLKVAPGTVTPVGTGWSVAVDPNGGFNATVPGQGMYSFTFQAQNSQGTVGTQAPTVTLNFPQGSGLKVKVVDGVDKVTLINDYRWIIEEDRTFYVDPNNTTNVGCLNPPPGGCTSNLTFGTNFHTSYMPVVAQGCWGPTGAVSCEQGQSLLGTPAVCDVGNGVCRTGASQQSPIDPASVYLDPTKRYYISVLPGDGANPFNAGYGGAPDCSAAGVAGGSCGHGMGGAPIPAGQTSVTVLSEPTPLKPGKLSVFVFEDDLPLNGEHDAGGGIDVLSPNEPGLGSFQITIYDQAGGTGDATGQPTYDMFNMPLSNSLAGTIDPANGNDACPITKNATTGFDGTTGTQGITGMILTCPKYESDGVTLSPLAGQAVVANLYPGRYGVEAVPAADRIARGEEWLQTNTLDGQHAHDSFIRVGEPAYFQEFGPAGYHVTIGFANPKIINDRGAKLCAPPTGGGPAPDCTYSVQGSVTTVHMSRTPDQRLYSSGSRDAFSFTQCYVSLGDPDDEDFAFTKCDENGNFVLPNIPPGNWKVTIFDQWNDQIVDGIATPVSVAGGSKKVVDMGPIAVHQWQANIYTSTFFDQDGDGLRGANEPGLSLVPTNIRFRDGSFSNFNNTDLNGDAGFNEVFPLFSWYVVETDSTRYKNTGTHVVYDAGGPSDGSADCKTATTGSTSPCGSSSIGQYYANTMEQVSLPPSLRVPGAVYCDNADCTGFSIKNGPGSSQTGSTGRIDPPWVVSEGWQGFAGQNSFLEFGKTPFAPNENGGIHGHVVYASTRPFDDPTLLLQLSWEPLVPHVTINLYREGTAPDGTQSLKLVDTTQTSSFDDWAQGFHSDGNGNMVPNMNCPGQTTTADPFFFSLQNQPNYLDWYNAQHGGSGPTALPNNSQFKCYDGMHNWNQLQPAPYDGIYQFPSVKAINPTTGKPVGTNCDPSVCVPNPDKNDPYRYGTPMLPAGKYVVEIVVPPGYELVKEEDKNILIGDNYIAPVTQEFAGLGNIFILPDQAEINAFYNAGNAQNPTNGLGRTTLPSHEADTGSMETFWPCVGESRTVPDFISLFPGSAEVAPFAGATRNLCDRKEVMLENQTSALAKFYVFTPTHVAAHFTGIITDDLTAEFDPFSPQFGEKFAPAYLPVSIKDFNGNEVNRVYADQWGAYNGLNYSTWEVNPPNPTGYAPTMMITCMNDAGLTGTGTTPDPLYQPGYSQFCYELPFMPGQTGYFDTPVISVSAFSDGYNHPDCDYPDATPAVSEVDGDVTGPWVGAQGHTITIKALGDEQVENHAYSGPAATAAPFNQKKVTRHYGFGMTQGTGSVTIGGVPASITSWSDTQIIATVNTSGMVNGKPVTMPACAVQQQTLFGGSAAQCGQLVITAGNGKQSVDTVTVTVGGKQPKVLGTGETIQSAIDAAKPGDMIIVPQGTYKEILLMWKPIRLQGVGAASSIIAANAHPAGTLDPWRRQVSCLFGLAMNGQPSTGNVTVNNGQVVPNTGGSNPYDSTGTYQCPMPNANYFSGGPNYPNMVVDRVPMEGILGWDTTVNGNLAEQLIEPGLMGAYEGAAITVLGKGVNIPNGATDVFGSGAEAAFPDNSVLLSAADCTDSTGNNPYPSNFWCNPSSIDGLGVSNSSQGGGGIFVHAWGHNIQIANNRVHNNTGTLAGGITVGQGEHVDVPLQGGTVIPPGTCQSSAVPNQALPYCYDMNVHVHHNSVTLNSSIGDELFSSSPAGSGGVAFCNGSDYYKFDYNWVCGNLSSGDGGGVSHIGFIYNGDIEHNSILFNQSTNPSVPTNGGGLLVMGAPDPDPLCGALTDKDCVPPAGEVPPSDGSGPNLFINANLIQGNAAEAGSGGGIRLQHVNGTDVINLPSQPSTWNSVTLQNNIIVNNVAGWDGAGVSLQDALNVNLINNTIVSNDATASSGVLFNSLFAPLSSSPGTNCFQGATPTTPEQSCPQIAGVASTTNSPNLIANLAAVTVTCPAGHYGQNVNDCTKASIPELYNNVIWKNRSFFIGVTGLGSGMQNMQNVVGLFNAFSGTPAASQAKTGDCPNGSSYWEIGIRGDKGPANHNSGYTLAPMHSVLTDAVDYPGAGNLGSDPQLTSQYCNGSRVPPENGGMAYLVAPGTNENNAPTPLFSLTPTATVDEGNNWINMRWGPLSMTNQSDLSATNYGKMLGNFAPQPTSPVVDAVPTNSPTYSVAPSTDFFGNPRPDVAGTQIDIGAVEVAGSAYPNATVSPTSLAFGSVNVGTTSSAQTVTLSNTGDAALTIGGISVTAPFARPTGAAGGTCTTSLGINATCTINVVFSPTAAGPATSSLTISGLNDPANSSLTVALTGTGLLPPTGSVNPTSLAFGNQATNVTSAIKTVTLSNSGSSAMAITSISTSGNFARNTTVANNCGTSVAGGGSCNIGVTFRPTSLGAKSGTLTILTNAVNSNNGNPAGTFTVPLTGTGVAMSVNPTSLAFGNQVVGTTSAAQTLILSNGSGSSKAIAIAVTGPFARTTGTNNCGTNLTNNNSCNIYVVFSPTVTGAATGSVTITSSITVSNSPVGLSGTGVTAVRTATVSPSPLAFGNQAIGTASGAKTLTVTNTGNVNLTGGTFTFGGGAPQPFSRATFGQGGGGTCGTTLNVGASCTYNVVFTPANGTVNATAFSRILTVSYTNATVTGSPVTLTGTGVTPGTLSFSSATNGTLSTIFGVRTLTFAIPTPRAPVTSVVTVSNVGAGSLQITADALSGSSRFTVTGTTCSFTTPLAAGATCTISVTYATPANQPQLPNMGALSLSNNGSGTLNGNSILALSGR